MCVPIRLLSRATKGKDKKTKLERCFVAKRGRGEVHKKRARETECGDGEGGGNAVVVGVGDGDDGCGDHDHVPHPHHGRPGHCYSDTHSADSSGFYIWPHGTDDSQSHAHLSEDGKGDAEEEEEEGGESWLERVPSPRS